MFFKYINLSWKHKCKQTFAIACSFIVNKLRETDSEERFYNIVPLYINISLNASIKERAYRNKRSEKKRFKFNDLQMSGFVNIYEKSYKPRGSLF